ncbi:MAG: transaldolase [Thermoguttaceae bacterium]
MTSLKDQPPRRSGENVGRRSQAGNPLMELRNLGQSIWLDNIRRQLIVGGELKRLIADDHVTGITSNPSIFEKAIAGSTDYDDLLAGSAKNKDLRAMTLYEDLAIRDIKDAADLLRPIYEQTRRLDGYVSLEVSPYLAHDDKATVAEAHRLWDKVGRENLLIKVPATPEGIPAIRQLIAEGINVNVTLLFSRKVYEQVADAYIKALEELDSRGGDVSRMAGVASFFVSRIDSSVDALVESRLAAATDDAEKTRLRSIPGRVAIANAKLTYQKFKEIIRGKRWQALAAKGARVQRLLWASTSTKNPNYRDVLYVEELIGRDTVNTLPPATLDAFREHGRSRPSLEENIDDAREVMETLAQAGISMDEITDKLLDDGVRLFAESFDRLLAAVEKKRIAAQI